MPYTVVRERKSPHATAEDDDARLVSAQLLKRGVPLDRAPRVSGQNGWLYVWDSREEAESAAEQLTRRTRDRWVVRETDAEPSLGPLLWLRIDVGRESDGLVFALDPITRLMVQKRFPGSCRHSSIFVAVESDDDLQADSDHFLALSRQALFMLTWVPLHELAVFGAFQVVDVSRPAVLLPPTSISA